MMSSLKFLFGSLLLFLLIYKIGFDQIWGVFKEVNIILLLGVIIIKVLSLIVGNFNLYILLRPSYKSLKFWGLFRHYISSWYISFFAPGRLGTTTIIYFLKK